MSYACGIHFCDYCGDCMRCFGDYKCTGPTQEHYCSIEGEEMTVQCKFCRQYHMIGITHQQYNAYIRSKKDISEYFPKMSKYDKGLLLLELCGPCYRKINDSETIEPTPSM
jgi:hypothetical protein